MTFSRALLACTIGLVAVASLATTALAQPAPPPALGTSSAPAAGAPPGAPGGAPAAPPGDAPGGPPGGFPQQFVTPVVAPPQSFKTAEEHYNYLLAVNRGGTKHTIETVPQWPGLWQFAYNSVGGFGGTGSPFFEGPGGGIRPGGTVKTGVLTPVYEAAFQQRRAKMLENGGQGQLYDRLTTCEAAGPVRWLAEPDLREWVNLPTQSWWLNDLANDTRRIYIDQDHKNIDGTNSPEGDSIGFWAGDKLVVWTKDMWPGDWGRGMPVYSNEMQMVEVVYMKVEDNGLEHIIDQVTFYDPVALSKPLSAVYTFERAWQVENAGYRIRHWDCDTPQRADGDATNIRLPGEDGKNWLQRRAPDLPADLPGQTRTPGEVDFETVFDNN